MATKKELEEMLKTIQAIKTDNTKAKKALQHCEELLEKEIKDQDKKGSVVGAMFLEL